MVWQTYAVQHVQHSVFLEESNIVGQVDMVRCRRLGILVQESIEVEV